MSRIETYTVTRMIDVDGDKVLRLLLQQKRVGVLTLHIGAGKVGAVEWKEKDQSNGRGAGSNGRSPDHVSGIAGGILDGAPPPSA